jgi:hypothetical protein
MSDDITSYSGPAAVASLKVIRDVTWARHRRWDGTNRKFVTGII